MLLAALSAVGCAQDREGRLREVLVRSRAAPDRIAALEAPFLLDPDPDVRALAVWAVGEAQAVDAASILAPLAADPHPAVRLAVARALCRRGEQEALEALVGLSSDAEPAPRGQAVRCLAASESPPAEVLVRCLLDTDREIRAIALEALARHPAPGSLSNLAAVFEARRDPLEQQAAVAAIRALRDPAAVPALERAAASRMPPALRDAVEAAILDLRAVSPVGPAEGTSAMEPE